MINAEIIQSCPKEGLSSLNPTLDSGDIEKLVAWLIEKDDNFRYKCFLLLQDRSEKYADVNPFWDVFVEKLESDNSYQRSLGLMLIAENVRWDLSGKFDSIVDLYLEFTDDDKPVTVRQCIQSLCKIIPFNKDCHSRIIEKLISIDLLQRKETQRKLLQLDILSVLTLIRKYQPDERIDRYIQNAMTGEILDSKAKKILASML